MARESINMLKLRQILRLNHEKKPVRQISELLGLHRKTVTKYIVLYESSGLSYNDISALSDEELHEKLCAREQTQTGRYEHLESLLPDMEKELRRVGVTKFRLWKEYKRANPGGYNYTQYCHYFRQWQKKDEAVMHFEHKAGDKLFVDYTGKKLHITDRESGELLPVEVFVAVLGASGMTYVEASLS